MELGKRVIGSIPQFLAKETSCPVMITTTMSSSPVSSSWYLGSLVPHFEALWIDKCMLEQIPVIIDPVLAAGLRLLSCSMPWLGVRGLEGAVCLPWPTFMAASCVGGLKSKYSGKSHTDSSATSVGLQN